MQFKELNLWFCNLLLALMNTLLLWLHMQEESRKAIFFLSGPGSAWYACKHLRTYWDVDNLPRINLMEYIQNDEKMSLINFSLFQNNAFLLLTFSPFTLFQ